MKTAAIYCRVSGEAQEREGTSLYVLDRLSGDPVHTIILEDRLPKI